MVSDSPTILIRALGHVSAADLNLISRWLARRAFGCGTSGLRERERELRARAMELARWVLERDDPMFPNVIEGYATIISERRRPLR